MSTSLVVHCCMIFVLSVGFGGLFVVPDFNVLGLFKEKINLFCAHVLTI